MTERETEAILAFKPPPLAMLRLWLAPTRAWHQPSFIGVEQVDPSRPTMFVGNHTLYGVQDVPHILYELRRVHGIFPRTLSDRVHFEVPVWRELLTAFGCVEGTRENCSALMRAGQHLMVFPDQPIGFVLALEDLPLAARKDHQMLAEERSSSARTKPIG